MSKSWFVRADYTVYADNLDQAISKWQWAVNTARNMGYKDVISDGIHQIYENEWGMSND